MVYCEGHRPIHKVGIGGWEVGDTEREREREREREGDIDRQTELELERFI